MEKDFTKYNETVQGFKARRAKIMNDYEEKCAKIQLEANIKKNAASIEKGDRLIILGKEEDDYMNAYRAWKLEQSQANQPQE